MSELKPCPFCGGRADIEEIPGVNGVAFSAGCNSENEDDTGLCMGYQHTASFSRRSEAIEAWNRRADTPSLLRGARIGLEMAAKAITKEQDRLLTDDDYLMDTKDCCAVMKEITDDDIMKEISREG